jgi:hypothetical protein
VLEIAQEVHSSHTGANERHPDEQIADIRLLELIYNTWEPSTNLFDACVHAVVCAALREVGHL